MIAKHASILKVALIQLNAGPDKSRNISKALRLVKQACRQKPHFILLPEAFEYRGSDTQMVRQAEPIPGPTIRRFKALASEERVAILLGSVVEKSKVRGKVYNTSILINSKGWTVARYRKIHLFNSSLKNASLKESRSVVRGHKSKLIGMGPLKFGLSICYDLRFPEMYHTYARRGANILLVPSNFTHTTGKAHWEILLRSRAIENQCFVLAPNQCGVGFKGVRTYGNSLVIDPWGRVLARGSTSREGIITAVLNLNTVQQTRRLIPSLKDSRKKI